MTVKTTTTMLEAALACARLGIPIFPCKPNRAPLVGADKDAGGNRIQGTGGFKKATTDEATITAWWTKYPRAMIGAATGPASGFVVLDIDVKHGRNGYAELPDWEERSPLIVRTGSGGAHLYFNPEGAPRNSQGKIDDGLDTRGEGGYVILPPSVADNGGQYIFHKGSMDNLADLPPFPKDLLERMALHAERQESAETKAAAELLRRGGTKFDGLHSAIIEAELAVQCARMAACREGRRHSTLLSIANQFGRLIEVGMLDEQVAVAKLEEAALRAWSGRRDWGDRQNIPTTIRDGIRYGKGLSCFGVTWEALDIIEAQRPADDNDWVFDRLPAVELRQSPDTSPKPGGGEADVEPLVDEHTDTAAEPEPDKADDKQQKEGQRAADPKSEAEPKAEPDFFDPWDNRALPTFPMEVLSEPVRAFVETQSANIGCDPSGLAMASLANLSGAIDHRVKVRMGRHREWEESPRLWVVLVGDPSTKKTPAINAATREMEYLAANARREHMAAVARWETNGKPEGEAPSQPPAYVVHDTTVEKLGEILARSDRGVLVKRDELSGWIGDMDRYGGRGRSASDRAFWLKMYDGGPYSVERVMRGGTYIGNASCSIIGGIQPDRLAELKNLSSDGLLQRFLPIMMGPSQLPKDEPPPSCFDDYPKLVRSLLAQDDDALTLSEEAYVVMQELHAYLHDLEAVTAGAAYGFQGFVGKLAGVAGRLAVVLHMIDEMPDPNVWRDNAISGRTMLKVQTLIVDFLLPHAYEFYRNAESKTVGDRLQTICGYILTSKKQGISSRDLVRNVAFLRNAGSKDIEAAVAPLIAAGWLSVADFRKPLDGKWVVSAGLGKHFEARRVQEEERLRKLAKLMGSPRRPVE